MSNLIHDSNSTISELTKKLATQLTAVSYTHLTLPTT